MKIAKKMNSMKYVIIGLLFHSFTVVGQELIPMGNWRTHFNYQKTLQVEKTATKIYASTNFGLVYYDPNDGSLNKLSKIDGLSSNSVSALKYNVASEYLAIGYETGHVDIITSEGIIKLPVLYESDVTENKKVNHISFQESMMNVSTDFGLLVLNTDNQVKEAYQHLGDSGEVIRVNSSLVFNEQIYLATEKGVLLGSLINGDNLQDFNNWERFSGSVVYDIDVLGLAEWKNQIYSFASTDIFKYSANNWSQESISLDVGETITNLIHTSQNLIILTNQRVLSMDGINPIAELNFEDNSIINDILQEDAGTFWYADNQKGLSMQSKDATEHYVLNGPSSEILKLKNQSNLIYAFPDFINDYTSTIIPGSGYSVFESGSWTTLDPNELNSFSNVSDILFTNEIEILSSFGNGMLDRSNNTVFDYTNSILQEFEAGTENTLVTGLGIDESGSIWLTNFGSPSLYHWNGGEDWQVVNFGSSAAREATSIAVNSYDQIWMSLGLTSGYGVLAYDIETDASRYINISTTQLPSNQVNDIVFGLNDEVWFATDLGIAYFPFSYGVIQDQSLDVTLPLYEGSIAFENKKINALAIDGGNRLWIGAQDGLWLFNDGFTELIEHFDIDNSPLPSNEIIDISIQPETGEIFVLTENGLVSYRMDGSSATNVHQQVSIFPNPVIPNYNGWVGLSGLAKDVGIKITTVSGHLVREINAAGGSASWDLNDYSGSRVNAGVYLFFSSNEDGSETYVGKLAVLN